MFCNICCITTKRVTTRRVLLYVIATASNTAPFEEKLQRWRAVGNTMSDLIGLGFEPQSFRFTDERVTAQPTGRLSLQIRIIIFSCLVDADNKFAKICRIIFKQTSSRNR